MYNSQREVDTNIPKISSEDPISLNSIKGNVKNAYIKKIKSLVQLQSHDCLSNKQEFIFHSIKLFSRLKNLRTYYNLDDSSDSNLSGDDKIDGTKLKKNRESAKNSRQRKKLYIGLLERKIEDFSKQIELLKQSTQVAFNHVRNILLQNQPLTGMIIEQTDCLQEIQKENNQLGHVISSYKYKFGSSGSKRRKYLKMCLKIIMKSMLDGNYGMLLSDFSCLEEVCENDEQKRKVLSIFQKLKNHRENKKKQKALINQLIRLIKELKIQFKQLQKGQKDVEDVIEDCTDDFNPQMFRKLILQQDINMKKDEEQEQKIEPQNNIFLNQIQYFMAQQRMNQGQTQLPFFDPLYLNEIMLKLQNTVKNE